MTFRSSARLRVRTVSGATRLFPARSPTASSALGSPNTTVARTEASGTTASAPVLGHHLRDRLPRNFHHHGQLILPDAAARQHDEPTLHQIPQRFAKRSLLELVVHNVQHFLAPSLGPPWGLAGAPASPQTPSFPAPLQ